MRLMMSGGVLVAAEAMMRMNFASRPAQALAGRSAMTAQASTDAINIRTVATRTERGAGLPAIDTAADRPILATNFRKDGSRL